MHEKRPLQSTDNFSSQPSISQNFPIIESASAEVGGGIFSTMGAERLDGADPQE